MEKENTKDGEITGPAWGRLVRDRKRWKSLEETFVDRQAVQ